MPSMENTGLILPRDTLGNPGLEGSGPPERLAHIHFHPLGEKFAGRKALLDDLAARLQPGKAHALSQRAVVKADGGVGKTAVAVELAWRLYHEGKFAYAFLLNATSPEAIDSDLAALCSRDWLNLPEQEAKEPGIRLAGVLRWLKTPANAARTLLVLDGADAAEARAKVRALHPLLPGCAMLVTSRQSVGGGFREEKLDTFTPGEAREFLRTHLPPAFLQDADADAMLDGLAQAVDHLPLALELVASHLRESHLPPRQWLREWQQAPASTIEHHSAGETQYPVSLFRVWEQSVARLPAEARERLHALAWFAPRPAAFPMKVLREKENWNQLRSWLGELEKASLIEWQVTADEITIHRVLQAVMRHRMGAEEKAVSKAAAVAILGASLPDPDWSEAGWRLWERLVPHLEAVLGFVRDTEEETAATRLMNQFGYWLRARAQYAEAEPLYRRGLEIDEKSLGKDHPTVAIRLNNLAALFKVTNRLTEAEPLMRRALEIDEKSFGKDHPEVATDLNNLANLLQATNRLAEAEPLMRRALEIVEKSFGNDHPNVAIQLNNLAQLLQATNRLAEAEPLMRRALEIDKRSFGNDHPEVARDLNNLAVLLKATNRLAEAEPLMRRVLEIDEESLGKDHPNVAIRLNNLATLFQATNRLAEAEPLMRRALEIDEKSYGKDHPDVARDINNLAQLLRSTNRLAGAEPLSRWSLEILLRFTARTRYEHPHLQTALENYTGLLAEMGWAQERIDGQIKELMRQCKEAVEKERSGGKETQE
jgi:tetratricopeptide (TPR) repeat protein